MKKIFTIMTILVFNGLVSFAQEKLTQEEIMAKVSKGKPFTLVILKKGTSPQVDPAVLQKMQMDHLVNLFQMEKDGKISIFGPVNKDEVLQGIIVFNTTDKEMIKKELDNDPFIKGGYISYELYEWFSIPGQKVAG